MVGSAVAMMVWLSAASSAASIRPKKMVRTSAWLTLPCGCAVAPTGSGAPVEAETAGLRARSARRRSRRRFRASTRGREMNGGRFIDTRFTYAAVQQWQPAAARVSYEVNRTLFRGDPRDRRGLFQRLLGRAAQRLLFDQQHGDQPDGEEHGARRE